MNSTAAAHSQGKPSTAAAATASSITPANAAPSPSLPAAAASSTVSPTYTFSAEATPFIPSFMRAASVPAPLPPPETCMAEESNEEMEDEVEPSADGSEAHYRHHFSKQWMLCLEQMQGQEVGMLMEMMPLDIQDLYFDRLSDEYLHHDHEHKDKGVHALRAAQLMVQSLSPEQLAYIEAYLEETDALNPDAQGRRRGGHLPHHDDGGSEDDEEDEPLFMNEDDGMGQEEEEWLLEQMMVAAGHAEDVAPGKKRK